MDINGIVILIPSGVDGALSKEMHSNGTWKKMKILRRLSKLFRLPFTYPSYNDKNERY